MLTVSELTDKLSLEVISEGEGGREITGCYAGDLLSWVMGRARAGEAWITIMSNVNVAAVAALADVSCVILAEAVEPDEALLGKLSRIDAALLRSPLSAYELCWRIHDAVNGA